MIFKQFRYEPAGQASYLLACDQTKEGLAVDPIADLGPDFYRLEAADLGVTLVGVLETHLHADYVSCARELAGSANVPHYLHETAAGRVRYEFTPVRDGEILTAGQVELQVLFTPGHTPEHVSYLVTDRTRGTEPWFVLTGDSLLVGDVGRPDLLVGNAELDVIDEHERAAMLYRSIKDRLFSLPDRVEVYPNHYGGSSCGGANLSGKASSTIGTEKLLNLPMLQPDGASFEAFVRGTSRPAPEGYRRIKAINLGLEAEAGHGRALTAEEVGRFSDRGAVLVDVRPALRFAAGHLPGSVNLQFNRADLADRALLTLPENLELVVIGDADGVAREAVELLEGAGLRVAGYLSGGAAAWAAAKRPLSTLGVIRVDELHERLAQYQVIDARERHEYRRGHIQGALLRPSSTAWNAADEVPGDKRLAVHCAGIVRAGLVGSILARTGANVTLVAGGFSAWKARGYEVAEEHAAGVRAS